MSHNQMSERAMLMFAEGLKTNNQLTDFFFTHNDLREHETAGLEFIKTM